MKQDLQCAIGLVVLVGGIAALSHYGWQLPAGVCLFWMAYNIDQKMRGK